MIADLVLSINYLLKVVHLTTSPADAAAMCVIGEDC